MNLVSWSSGDHEMLVGCGTAVVRSKIVVAGIPATAMSRVKTPWTGCPPFPPSVRARNTTSRSTFSDGGL